MSRLIAPVHINPQIKTITYPGVKKNTYQIMDYGPIFENGVELRQFINPDGYYQVSLKNDSGGFIHPMVSRLVAWEFCSNRDLDLEVDHVDGIRINNDYRNLEWVTSLENTRRMYNKHKDSYKDYKTPEQIYGICKLLQDTDLSYIEICNAVGLNLNYNQAKALCGDLMDRKYWWDISFKFDFSRRNGQRRRITEPQKLKLFQIYLKTGSIEQTYADYYGKPYKEASHKEKDNFRHIMKRIILKFTDHP